MHVTPTESLSRKEKKAILLHHVMSPNIRLYAHEKTSYTTKMFNTELNSNHVPYKCN